MPAPIQVVLEPTNFHQDIERVGGGGKTDFFAHRDAQFMAHRDSLAATFRSLAVQLEGQPTGGIGYLKVFLRRKAWAKSHRPFMALFKFGLAPCVGGLDLGQLIIRVTPETLREIAGTISRAEDNTREKLDPNGKLRPNPSRIRSEVGAIERVELFGAADRRNFTIEQAVVWLSQMASGHNYEVELFEAPKPLTKLDSLEPRLRKLFQSFQDGLVALGQGFSAQRITSRTKADAPRLTVRVERADTPANVQLLTRAIDAPRSLVPFDDSKERHAKILHFLEHHPLVRSIRLPGRVIHSSSSPSPREWPSAPVLPTRDSSRSYPRVGVIDSGIGPALSDWIIGRWELLDDSQVEDSHGSFIGGLLVAGTQLNAGGGLNEVDGVELYDARVFPKDPHFSDYYIDLEQFFGEVEQAIITARNQHNVRIFNLSLNVAEPVSSDAYSRWADRLDQFADEQDVLIFMSVGNYEDLRPEWPEAAEQALAMLAVRYEDTILSPAESARNASVGALNPAGLSGVVPYAPTRYTRRGPGLRALVKPDYCQVGGVGAPISNLGHGLFSINSAGGAIDGCGTSYAAPLVAKTASRLDHSVEGELSRETILALLCHHSTRPDAVKDKLFDPVARQLIGHGMPLTASEMLVGGDHEITLVFATRLPPEKQLVFPFSWPPSLTADGSCRGYARLSLVASPPLDQRFGAEFVRINIDAALQQYNPEKDGWEGRLKPAYLPSSSSEFPLEAERIEYGLKWSPVKLWEMNRRGIGKSSDAFPCQMRAFLLLRCLPSGTQIGANPSSLRCGNGCPSNRFAWKTSTQPHACLPAFRRRRLGVNVRLLGIVDATIVLRPSKMTREQTQTSA